MKTFFYKEPYEENGKTVLEVNLFPDKYCNFNCIFCPVSRKLTHIQTEETVHLDDMAPAMGDLQQRLRDIRPDLVFINSLGEALLLPELEQIIHTIHEAGIPIRLLSNGYLYGNPDYARLAGHCEEVIGELKMAHEEAFQKAQRPLPGYTLHQHIDNMARFRKNYSGRFHLEITIVKGYSDDADSLEIFHKAVQSITPDELHVVTLEPPFDKVLAIAPERLEEITRFLQEPLNF